MENIRVTLLKGKAQRLSQKLILRIKNIANNTFLDRLLGILQIIFALVSFCTCKLQAHLHGIPCNNFHEIEKRNRILC
jgi:hypothetical protein